MARGGDRVAGTGYEWHEASDGAATFPVEDGGWILVSNSETLDGGASAVRFRRDGALDDAYRILGGTSHNCSGGGTPWGTWLSCEEVEDGIVWECDPAGRRDPVRHPAMGVFKHEAAAVDQRGRRVYLTEDLVDGRFYRYTPERWPSLATGLLEVATVAPGGRVTWTAVPDPSAHRTPTRRQVSGSTALKRGEGVWRDGRTVYVATTADDRVHAYDIDRERMRVLYDGLASPDAPLLRVDQLTANRAGEVFVCEDIATKEIDIGVIEPLRPGIALPLRDRPRARELGADRRGLRSLGQPDVLLLAARGRLPRASRAWARFMRFPGLFEAGGLHTRFTRPIKPFNRTGRPGGRTLLHVVFV